jgi:SIR2-like domain
MPQAEPKKKIVYLLGAGATHAELTTLLPTLNSEDKVQRKLGLLMSQVSTRVIQKASLSPNYLKGVEFLEPRYLEGVQLTAATAGSQNIELLISLIENSKIHQWERKTRMLRDFVQKDIEGILTPPRCLRFYLHKALFEFHTHPTVMDREELHGIISLNYDNVLDQAYKEFYGKRNYCFSLVTDQRPSDHVPLLKLHGSFNWTRGVVIRGRARKIEIIPLGSNKNYLHAPYSFIWSRALEILIGCDTLRVVGCSLSQNDTHLVDLLFKAHLERNPGNLLSMEIISSEAAGERIRQNYGFFPGIRTLARIEENLIGDADPPNAFKTWLARKTDRALGESIRKTRYLRKLKQ